jgi:outer membrane receptor protein involved in Fe transport
MSEVQPGRIFRTHGLFSILLASTALTGITPAFAQDDTLETVIVTAEKRAEDIQAAPLAVQALGTQKLEDLNISGGRDFSQFFPSLTYTVGGGGGTNGQPGTDTYYMRGVSSGGDGNHSAALPSVGVYLDEQPITTIGGAMDVHIYDIARVEALAGPQGTLYGASSQAGTVRIITNKPDASKFEAGYDIEANKIDNGGFGDTVEGFVNIPLQDNIAVRLVAYQEHDAGFIDNVAGTRTYPTFGQTVDNSAIARDDYNTVENFGGRAELKIDLDENWTIMPAFIGQVANSNGVFAFDPSVGDLEVMHYKPEWAHDRWYQASLTVQGKIANLDLVYSGGYMDRTVKAALDYSDYTFWYDTLHQYGSSWVDNNYSPVADPTQYQNNYDHFTKWSHELRVSTPQDYRLRAVAGLFYERQSHFIQQDYLINGLGAQYSVNGLPGTIWLTEQERIDRDYAAFGEASFDILPDLTLTGGLRYFISDNSMYGFFGFGSNFSGSTGASQCPGFDPDNPLVVPGPTFFLAPCSNLDKSVSKHGTTYKWNLSYKLDDGKMLYATWSTGFRPGGVNRRGTVPPYQPDTLINYEIGWKTSWFDDTLRFNGDFYLDEWKNFQFSFLGLNSFTEIHNAASARISGFEADVNWLAAPGLTITGGMAYTHATLSEDFCGFSVDNENVTVCPGPLDPYGPQAPKGTMLPGTPRFKANATARYERELDEGLLGHIQGAVNFQTESFSDLRLNAPDPTELATDANNIPLPGATIVPVRFREAPYAIFDFALGVDRENWSADLMLQNAFDERAQRAIYAECTTQICGHQPYIVPSRPRTVAIRFSQRF